LGQPQSRKYEHEIRRVNEKLENAQNILATFPGEQAAGLLQEAIALIEQAKGQYGRGSTQRALSSLSAASTLIDKALSLAMDGSINRNINRLLILLEQAENVVFSSGKRDAHDLLKLARKHESDAKNALNRGNIIKASEKINLAYTLAEKAIRLAGSTPRGLDLSPADVEGGENRFETFAERVREAVKESGSRQAQDVFQRALKEYNNLNRKNFKGKAGSASAHYEGAMRLLLRAYDLATKGKGGQSAQQTGQEIEVVKALYFQARDQTSAGMPRRADILQRIQSNIIKAESANRQSNKQSARIYLKLARQLLSHISRGTGDRRESLKSRVVGEGRALEDDLAAFEQNFSGEDADSAALLRLAKNAARLATIHINRGQFQLAAQRVFIAQRFLSKAGAGKNRMDTASETAAARSKIDRLQMALENAETALTDSNERVIRQNINDAAAMLKQAEAQLKEGRTFTAFELAEFGLLLVTKALRQSRIP